MSHLEDYLQPGDGVLDIGANIGSYAQRYAHRVGPTGSVLAIEPDPDTADAARTHCAALPWVSVMTVAVGAQTGTATLYRDQTRARNSLWAANVIEADGAFVVHVVTLDVLATSVPNLRGIKIDAQGAEADILAGGGRTLTDRALTWQVELWPTGLQHAGASADAVCDVLEQAGWRPIDLTWASVRDKAQRHQGHSALDIVLQHQERV